MESKFVNFKSIIISTLLLASINLLVAENAHAVNSKQIVMGFHQPIGNPIGDWLSTLYTEAFRRIGYKMIRKTYPSKRLTTLLNKGKIDGELGRVYSYGNNNSNIRRVNIPHWKSKFNAYATNQKIVLNGWQSLQNTDLRVEYPRGIKICELMLPRYVKAENLSTIERAEQGLKKLLVNRTDIFIYTENAVEELQKKPQFKYSGLQKVGLMEKVTAHAYLHEKHHHLLPALEKSLKKMKEEGLFLKYKNRFSK